MVYVNGRSVADMDDVYSNNGGIIGVLRVRSTLYKMSGSYTVVKPIEQYTYSLCGVDNAGTRNS